MQNKISIFLPTRKNSERVINKNTRDFCGIQGGLLKIKLEQVVAVKNVDEVILSTNDENSIKVARKMGNSKIKILERPEHLCLSSTKISDLIAYVPTIIKNEVILWTHVTSPFVDTEDYNKAIDVFMTNLKLNTADSLASATKMQQFIWDDEKKNMINFDVSGGNWPRTQDLKPLYEINSAFFINKRSNYLKHNNRITPSMAIFVLEGIKKMDIDWEHDFMIAETLYEKLFLGR